MSNSEWRSYSRVSTPPNVSSHGTVSHSLHFVDLATGVHTQSIESYWARVKVKLKRMKRCFASQLPSYLDEFMWKERHGPTRRQAFTNIMRDIAIKFPVLEFLDWSLLNTTPYQFFQNYPHFCGDNWQRYWTNGTHNYNAHAPPTSCAVTHAIHALIIEVPYIPNDPRC